MISAQKINFSLLLFGVLLLSSNPGFSQTELSGWGNIPGIRIDGQLMEINSSILLAGNDWSDISQTAKERQKPMFSREGSLQVVQTTLGGFLSITETVEDAGIGQERSPAKY
jgi:hypothetical protein